MRIEIDKYLLTTGPKDFMISMPTGKFDKDGKDITNQQSYHGTLEDALSNVLKRKILRSDATSISELKKEIRKFRKIIVKHLDIEVTKNK